MQLRTDRLLLRRWRLDDVKAVRAALDTSDAHLRPWVPFMKREPQDLDGTRSWVTWRMQQDAHTGHLCLAVCDADDQQLYGEVLLMAPTPEGMREVGYWIDVRHVGKGIAGEAVRALVTTAWAYFEVSALEMHCASGNEASIAIPRRLGFHLAKTEVQAFENALGQLQDTEYWRSEAFDEERQGIAPLVVTDADGAELLRR